MKILCSILASALCLPGLAFAGEAGLDPSFGTGGRVISEFGNSAAGIEAAALAADGTIVAAGSSCSLPPVGGRSCDLALVRYSSQGQELQRTGAGFAPVPDLVPSDVAVDSVGRVIVVGRYYSQGWSPAVVRFRPDGSVDPSVSSAGLPDAFEVKTIDAVAIDDADRLYLAGPAAPTEPVARPAQVTRVLSTGSVDSSFGGGDGVASVYKRGSSAPQLIADMVLSPQGTIYVGGTIEVGDPEAGPSGAPLLSALSSAGEPLPQLAVPPGAQSVTGLALDSQGRLLATLEGESDPRLAVVRVLPDGSLDSSFGSDGVAGLPPCLRCSAGAAAVAVDGQDRPLVVSLGFELVRYTAGGSPDRSFAPGGSVAIGFGSGYQATSSAVLATSSDRAVVLGGRIAADGRRHFAAARFGAPSCLDRGATVVGTATADRLVGSPGRDVFLAGAGDDQIIGLGGNDLICAGAGSDRVQAGKGDDRVYGQAAPDRLLGGDGHDFLSGGAGIDLINGGRGKDRLR